MLLSKFLLRKRRMWLRLRLLLRLLLILLLFAPTPTGTSGKQTTLTPTKRSMPRSHKSKPAPKTPQHCCRAKPLPWAWPWTVPTSPPRWMLTLIAMLPRTTPWFFKWWLTPESLSWMPLTRFSLRSRKQAKTPTCSTWSPKRISGRKWEPKQSTSYRLVNAMPSWTSI